MRVITTTEELKDFVSKLLKEKFVTIDTEFVREFTYYPQLCLIQIAPGSGGDGVAIDPMAEDLNLAPLKKLLTDKKVVKVFHSGEQDIEMFHNELSTMPKPVFDTQIAAQVLGYGEAISYASLAKDICNKQLDKSSRFTDWSRRPLSEKQIEYAISDVTYLRDIYVELQKRLIEKDRQKWIEEDLAELVNPKKYENNPKEAWLKFRSKHSSPTFLGILREVAKWREETAQDENVPRGRVLRDDAVSEIAAAEPLTMDEIKRLRRIHQRSASRYGEEIISAVKRGRRNPIKLLLSRKKFDPYIDSEALLSLLKVLLKRQCERQHVAQKLVATVDELKEFSELSDREIEKTKLPLLHGWRREVFGKYAIKLMHGKLALTVEDNQVCMLEYSDDKK